MKALKTKVNGQWKPALIDNVKVNGVWKTVNQVWTKIAGEWVNDLKDITFEVTVANGVYILGTDNKLYTKEEYKVLGCSYDDGGGVHAYLYLPKKVLDLVSVTTDLPNWVLSKKDGTKLYAEDCANIGLETSDAFIQSGNNVKTPLNNGSAFMTVKSIVGKPVGVAVVSPETQFVISPTEKSSGTLWGGYGTVINNVVITADAATAKTDYLGKHNTDKIIEQLGAGNAPAAEYCQRIVFANGQKGYLPALGQWQTAYNNKTEIGACMSLIGGTAMDTDSYYWASTQESSDSSWLSRLSDGKVNYSSKNTYYWARAFADIVTDAPAKNITITLGNTTVTGDSPITMKGRLNHSYAYTINGSNIGAVGTVTVDGNKTLNITPQLLVTVERRFFPSGTYNWTVPENVTSIDVFLVGGGAGGADASGFYKAGSGSGYTKTYKGSGYVAPSTGTWVGTYGEGRDGNAISVTPGQSINIVVGAGGAVNASGGSTQITVNGQVYAAPGGSSGTFGNSSNDNRGGNGGSGGGGHQSNGGVDGANGSGINPGTGQGHTTRDFGEPTGTLNAAGSYGDGSTTASRGGYSDGSGSGNVDSGYGGAGNGVDGNTGGGDGTVLIRYKTLA